MTAPFPSSPSPPGYPSLPPRRAVLGIVVTVLILAFAATLAAHFFQKKREDAAARSLLREVAIQPRYGDLAWRLEASDPETAAVLRLSDAQLVPLLRGVLEDWQRLSSRPRGEGLVGKVLADWLSFAASKGARAAEEDVPTAEALWVAAHAGTRVRPLGPLFADILSADQGRLAPLAALALATSSAGSPPGLDALTAAARGPHPTAALAAMHGILWSGRASAERFDDWRPVADTPQNPARGLALRALAPLGIPPAQRIASYRQALADGTASERLIALRELAAAAADTPPETWRPLLQAEDGAIRFHAAQALLQSGAPDQRAPALATLAELAAGQAGNSPDPWARLEACRLRWRAGLVLAHQPETTGDFAEQLRHAMRQASPEDRLAAAEVWIAWRPADAREAVPTLIELARRLDWGVPDAAIRQLGKLGPQAADALPILRNLAATPLGQRESIREAIRAIETDESRPPPSIPGGD